MGEWLAWLPTVSLLSRSTDVSNGFGPGTSRRCRARVFYRRGRGWFCAGLLAFPAGYWGDAEMHWALRVRCVCRRCHRCSECRRVRLLSAPRALLGASARSPARPRPRWRSPHWWRVVCDERPGCGPAGALHTGGSWSVVSGQAAAPPALSTPAVHGVHARYSIRSTSTCAFALPNRCARHQFRMQFPCEYFKV